MKLQLMPRSPTIGAIKSKGNSNLQLLQEEFVSKLLNRRWMLEKPDTKIHQITFSKGQRQFGKGYFGDIHFSINTNPNLGDDLKELSSKDASFYIVRDDLLHPLINGNKARKLDALLPLVEDNSGTDVVRLHVEAAKVRMQLLLVAVSCAQRGITSHLLLRGEEPEILTGYNLVSKMYGNVVYVPRSLYAKREEMLIRHANKVAGANGSVLWFKDLGCSAFPTNGPARTEPERISGNHRRKVVIVNEGAGDAVALLGAIRLVHYVSQSHLLGDRPCTIVVDAGTGTTAVGLGLGALCLGLPWKVAAVTLADTVYGYKAQEKRLISDFKCFGDFNPLELTLNGSTDELISWTDRIKPRKFGKVLGGEVKACQQIATQTGISVDPVYTLAAWEQAMLLCQKEGKEGRNIVMLHTGGTLGLFGLAQRSHPVDRSSPWSRQERNLKYKCQPKWHVTKAFSGQAKGARGGRHRPVSR